MLLSSCKLWGSGMCPSGEESDSDVTSVKAPADWPVASRWQPGWSPSAPVALRSQPCTQHLYL